MEHFGLFVRSPYYNPNEHLVELFDHLLTLHPCFAEEQTEEALVYQSAFPGQPFDKKRLGYFMSGLLKLGEKFLGVQRTEKQEILFECQALRELSEREQEKHYARRYKKVKDTLDARQHRDGDSYYHNYLLADMELNASNPQKEDFDANLQAASNALDGYYFINKLKYSCEMLNRQAIVSEQFSIPFMEEVSNYLSSSQQSEPLVGIYLQIYYSMLYPDDNQHFKKLLELIAEHATSIVLSELKNIYLYAINICTRKIREGKEQFLAVALNLYEEGIRNKSLFDNHYLSHWTYNNIVKLALRLERFEWIEKFIYTYNASFQENALHYNLAELHFHKEDYGQALVHLNQVHSFDVKYHLVARILLIKAFYESNAIDACMSALASFTVYLSRNKEIAVSLKKSCQNFCALLHRVMSHSSQKKREKLRQQIRDRQPLADRAWLMKVFEDQEKKLK